jgi:hypothetical protein
MRADVPLGREDRVPTPLEFADKKDLITRLKADEESLAGWFERRYEDVGRIARDSVGSNTFRAFAHMPHPPSQVFYNWAVRGLTDDGIVRQITGLRSERAYDLWLKGFSKDLSEHWRRKMGRSMPYGPGRKLPNLLMKHVVLWRRLDDEQRSRLIGYLHVPFDKYSLTVLRNCVPDAYRPAVGRIRKDVTMKYVDSEAKYDALMALASEIAVEADVPPIYLDVLAWNRSHL